MSHNFNNFDPVRAQMMAKSIDQYLARPIPENVPWSDRIMARGRHRVLQSHLITLSQDIAFWKAVHDPSEGAD